MKTCENRHCNKAIKITSIDCPHLCFDCAELARRRIAFAKKFFAYIRGGNVGPEPEYGDKT